MNLSASGSSGPDPLLNTVLGGCRIESCLGKGGMGAVYKAHHLALDKPVAVKVLSSSLSSDPEFVKRFILEARSAAKLEHPNIVQILNVAQENGRFFIVMQFVEGETLDLVAGREGRMPLQRATRIIRDIAAGLAVAHKQSVVHRDIKPANILMTPEGGVRIVDFGLARQLKQGKGMTLEGTFLGTPEYVSPEQAAGRELDHRTDLYSLGIVYYELLCGRVPFRDGTAMEVAMKHMKEKLPPPDGIDPTAGRIVMKLLEKDPLSRHVSAEELLRDLNKLIAGGTITPRTVPAVPKPAAAGAAPAALSQPVPGTRAAGSVTPIRPPTASRPPTRPPTTRRQEFPAKKKRYLRNVVHFVLVLASAGLSLSLGGTAAAMVRATPVDSFLDALKIPFRSGSPDFVPTLAGGVIALLLLIAAFLVNRREYGSSPSPVLSGFLSVVAAVLFFAGAIHLPIRGEGMDRIVETLAASFSTLLDRGALLPVSAALLFPALMISFEGRLRARDRAVCGIAFVAAAAGVFLHAWIHSASPGPDASPAGTLKLACASVGLAALSMALFLLLPERGGGLKFLGLVLLTLGLAGFYACGTAWTAPAQVDPATRLLGPLEVFRSRFVLSGGPVVLGFVSLAWGAWLLYRRPGARYYSHE